MTEISFARSFLSALDMRPIKLSSDHVADPKQYPAQPAYTLPRLPNQPPKRKRSAVEGAGAGTSSSSTGGEATVNVSLRSVRGGDDDALALPSQPLSTSVYDLKAAYARHAGCPADKVRLLHSRKPVADSKTLKDVLGPAAEKMPLPEEVAFGVMVMGGGGSAAAAGGAAGAAAATPPAPERVASPPAEAPGPDMVAQQAAPSGRAVVQTEEFWDDLRGFLTQRIKDQREGERLAGVFRAAWQKDA